MSSRAWTYAFVAAQTIGLIRAYPLLKTSSLGISDPVATTSDVPRFLFGRFVHFSSSPSRGNGHGHVGATSLDVGSFVAVIVVCLVVVTVSVVVALLVRRRNRKQKEQWSNLIVSECRQQAKQIVLNRGDPLIPVNWLVCDDTVTAYTIDFNTVAVLLMQHSKRPIESKDINKYMKGLRRKMKEQSVIVLPASGEPQMQMNDSSQGFGPQDQQGSQQIQPQLEYQAIGEEELLREEMMLREKLIELQSGLQDLDDLKDHPETIKRRRLVLEQQITGTLSAIAKVQDQRLTIQEASFEHASRHQIAQQLNSTASQSVNFPRKMLELQQAGQELQTELQKLEALPEQTETVKRQRLIIEQRIAEKSFQLEKLQDQQVTIQDISLEQTLRDNMAQRWQIAQGSLGLEESSQKKLKLEQRLQEQRNELQNLEELPEQTEAVKRQRLVLEQQISEKLFQLTKL
jgi:hypothetical protein